ncbi:MAG: hypothetical protein H6822_11795 [Planctomycetaceae bacterium]|nr:hypothetical protein [Planctomycetales bacterium]MCB9922859.1 hypothetical protein [Planctomycetaceae bacterium]
MLRLKTALVLAIRYLFLTRYSWLLAIVLVAIVPVSQILLPRLLANLFVVDRPEQLFNISWISMWCAATVMETLRATTMNAHLRFDDYRIAADRFREAWGMEAVDDTVDWYRNRTGWFMMLLGLAVAVGMWHRIVQACIYSTVEDPSEMWISQVGSSSIAVMKTFAWQQAIGGLLTTVVLLASLNVIMILFHELRGRRERSAPPRWRQSLYGWLNALMGPGYFQTIRHSDTETSLHLAPGHFRLLLYTATFLVWYVINYVSATGDRPMPTELSPYLALFYALLSLLLLLYFLPGFAFFWDRYRIPVPLLIIVAVMLFYSTFGTDHYYELNLTPEDAASYRPPYLTEVFDAWTFPSGPDGKRTLVVVDASGGGIQASAWTAQVLTGLHGVYGNDFSRSIGLISSVSGGSVGTMFYLANRAEVALSPDPSVSHSDALTSKTMMKIQHAARASALEATAWGLAYPDTLRTVLPFAVERTVDRGWAIEQVWQQRMTSTSVDDIDRGTLDLVDLGVAIREKQLPVPVFNATLMESGQRLQISPVLGPARSRTDQSHRSDAPDAEVQLLKEFPHARPLVSTAARLSATFPYVTPAARASIPPDVECVHTGQSAISKYHVVDGAYVDNEGAVTSVDWINRLLAYYRGKKNDERPFDRVLLIRIQAFPTNIGQASGIFPDSASGWRSALIGPLDAMMTVRSASQTERGDLEVGLLQNVTQSRKEVQRREAELKKIIAVQDVIGDGATPSDPDPAANANLSPADLARLQAMSRDNSNRVSEITKTVEERADEEIRDATEVEVYSVMVDFRSPDKSLRIPMSWKLTTKQKANIDDAWNAIVDGVHPLAPLEELDQFFDRIDSRRDSR